MQAPGARTIDVVAYESAWKNQGGVPHDLIYVVGALLEPPHEIDRGTARLWAHVGRDWRLFRVDSGYSKGSAVATVLQQAKLGQQAAVTPWVHDISITYRFAAPGSGRWSPAGFEVELELQDQAASPRVRAKMRFLVPARFELVPGCAAEASGLPRATLGKPVRISLSLTEIDDK